MMELVEVGDLQAAVGSKQQDDKTVCEIQKYWLHQLVTPINVPRDFFDRLERLCSPLTTLLRAFGFIHLGKCFPYAYTLAFTCMLVSLQRFCCTILSFQGRHSVTDRVGIFSLIYAVVYLYSFVSILILSGRLSTRTNYIRSWAALFNSGEIASWFGSFRRRLLLGFAATFFSSAFEIGAMVYANFFSSVAGPLGRPLLDSMAGTTFASVVGAMSTGGLLLPVLLFSLTCHLLCRQIDLLHVRMLALDRVCPELVESYEDVARLVTATNRFFEPWLACFILTHSFVCGVVLLQLATNHSQLPLQAAALYTGLLVKTAAALLVVLYSAGCVAGRNESLVEHVCAFRCADTGERSDVAWMLARMARQPLGVAVGGVTLTLPLIIKIVSITGSTAYAVVAFQARQSSQQAASAAEVAGALLKASQAQGSSSVGAAAAAAAAAAAVAAAPSPSP